jgi:ATP-binding cassette subfamily B multidrug efflux pump
MRQAIFSHIQKLSFSFFDNNPVGKLVTRVTNDTENLNQMYTGVLVNLFKDIFMLVGIIIVMINIHTKLALVCMAAVPFIAFFTVIFRINARKAHRRVRTQLSKINAFLSEHISGMRIIQIFNREKQKQQEFDNNNTGYYKAALKELKVNAVFRPSIEFLFSMALSLLLWYGGGQLIKGNIEFGVLYAFVTYIQMFFQPINDLTEKFNIIQSAMASAEKIFYLLDQNDIIPDPKKPIPLEKVEGRIDFEHVWFAYKEGEWVLRDVSFTIHPGQTVAIVGATGAGKTSIINLMSRFYDVQKGRILIDGIPINRVKKEELRRHIGTVLQDVFLFTGDIESNIRLTSAEISPEKIREVARYVNAHKFIEKLPNKYHEEVMERGATLSTGQRQLLAFARALAFNPSILILDEATANIDTETEELIQDALVKLIEGRTTIAIAHRLSTIQHADKIMVMHRGKIREMGTHQELLSKRGLYYQLYQLQYKNGAVQEAMPY